MRIVESNKTPIVVDKPFALDLTKRVENHINVKPMWYCEYDFRFPYSFDKALAEFNNYIIRIVKATGAHILPITSIGMKSCGLPHIHAALCSDKRLKYDDVHIWRSGFSEQTLYQFGNTGLSICATSGEGICMSRFHNILQASG